ncbi:hypothetical protein NPIL_193711, partial [Nephila pilipes]
AVALGRRKPSRPELKIRIGLANHGSHKLQKEVPNEWPPCSHFPLQAHMLDTAHRIGMAPTSKV